MNIRPIKTEDDYKAALAQIDQLWNAPSGSSEAETLDVLATLVEAYERQHFPITAPSQEFSTAQANEKANSRIHLARNFAAFLLNAEITEHVSHYQRKRLAHFAAMATPTAQKRAALIIRTKKLQNSQPLILLAAPSDQDKVRQKKTRKSLASV